MPSHYMLLVVSQVPLQFRKNGTHKTSQDAAESLQL